VKADRTVAEFARRALALRGALVEEGPEGSLEAVLSGDLAARFGTEFLRMRFDPAGQDPAFQVVALGSAELERLGGLLGEDGRYVEVFVGVPYLKKEGLEEAVRGAFTFSGVRARFRGTRTANIPFLSLQFRYAALSDERRDGLVRISLDEATGAPVADVEERASAASLETRPADPENAAAGLALREIWDRACRIAGERIEADLADFRRSMDRRLGRDLDRVEEYYLGLREAIARRRGRAVESAEDKRRAVDAELESKRKDLAAKYAMRVEAELVGARRMQVPCVLAEFEIAKGAARREVAFVWNPLFKEIEPLACESCGRTTSTPCLCEARHLVCAACEKRCARCSGRGIRSA